MDEMDEIIEEFLVESHENLDRLDEEFVRLEDDPDDVDVLAGIFRDIHTIKGTSGFLGYAKLESVAHVGENLLSLLRDRELRLTAERTSALLAMVDAIREILQAIETAGGEGDGEYGPLVDRLARAASDDAPAPVDEPEADPADEDTRDDREPIGTILRDTVGVDAGEVEAAAQAQVDGDPRHIGEILVDRGVVDSGQVVDALRSQERQTSDAAARPAAEATIRVDVDLLDNLMNLVGELVLARNQIMQFTGETSSTNLIDTSQRLNLITTELQEGVMKTRMQPIGNVFSKFPRLVRDIALSLGKQVSVTMEGKETELDKTIIEAIKDPLTHMVRNSVDHGIESPSTRRSVGKPEQGNVALRAYHEGGQVNIEITDDGAGIDPARVAAKAVEKGVVTAEEARRMSQRELVNLVFAPGFSTAEEVSNLSGRGVGMDVVRTSIERIGGSVDIVSELGTGTTTKIKIPLTLAIIPALMVGAGNQRFAIPQVSLLELVRLDAADASSAVENVHGTPVYRLRGRLLPLVYLEEQLEVEPTESDAINIVVLQADDQQFGLVVQSVSDTAEIVVKPLGQVLKSIPTYAGATIMGDGRVALILDVLGLAQGAGLGGSGRAAALAEDQSSKAVQTESLLVFGLGDIDERGHDARMAVPLRQVARLEEIDGRTVERAGGKPVIQYRGQILPLIWLSEAVGVTPANGEDDLLQVIVYERGAHSVGFVVDRITDVLEEHLDAIRPSAQVGVRGSAVIGGKVTDLLDVEAVLSAIAPEMTTPEEELVDA